MQAAELDISVSEHNFETHQPLKAIWIQGQVSAEDGAVIGRLPGNIREMTAADWEVADKLASRYAQEMLAIASPSSPLAEPKKMLLDGFQGLQALHALITQLHRTVETSDISEGLEAFRSRYVQYGDSNSAVLELLDTGWTLANFEEKYLALVGLLGFKP